MMKQWLFFLLIFNLKAYSKCILPKAAMAADVIIMGETHGNKKQVIYATCFLQKLNDRKSNITLAVEMINQKDNSRLVDWITNYENADRLAIDIQWWKSGWPSWTIYRPLFKKAYNLQLALIATDSLKHSSKVELKEVWNESFNETYRAWADIISSYHQNKIEASKLDELIKLQMSRDIHMTNAIKDYKKINPDQQILFYTGQDHARNTGTIKELLKPYKAFTIAQNCPKLNHNFDFNTQKCIKDGE